MPLPRTPPQPYVYQEYPKMKYHPDRDPVVVDDYDQEKALGADWYDSPTAATEAKEKLRQMVSGTLGDRTAK